MLTETFWVKVDDKKMECRDCGKLVLRSDVDEIMDHRCGLDVDLGAGNKLVEYNMKPSNKGFTGNIKVTMPKDVPKS